MIKDRELELIASICRSIDELYDKKLAKLYGEKHKSLRARRYIYARYRWMFDWLADDNL